MYNNPPDAGSSTPAPSEAANRNARYTYLVGRLRSRQITMEEATELFAVMQSNLTRSEASRLAAMAQITAGRAAPTPRVPPPPPGIPTTGNSDELLLLGLLAMGAGVGLLAALTKRVQELSPAAAPAVTKDPPAAPQ